MTEENLLVPLDVYLKTGLHIGTKFKTEYMKNFIYKVRPDGLSVLNVQKINDRLAVASKFIAQYEPEDIIVVGRRENSWKAIKAFSKATGVNVMAGRYMPGTLTNSALETFREAKLIILTDPWVDKNILLDAVAVGIPIVALCDTNNESNYLDLVVPCNNKGKKSLGLIFFILAKEYLKIRKLIKSDEEFKYKLDDFSDE